MKKIRLMATALFMLMTATATQAQDEEVTVSAEHTWVFDDYAPIDNGDKEFEGTDDENIWEMDGLYIRNFKGRYAQMYNGNMKGTFSDGTDWKCTAYLRTQGNKDFLADGIHDKTAATKVVAQTDRSLAFNTSMPGTCYVILKPCTTPKAGDDRDQMLYFNHTLADVKTVTSTTNTREIVELKYTSEEAGVFYIVPGISTMIYAIKFVPAKETGIKQVKKEGTGNDKYYDFSGREISKPSKGRYIHNGKKYIK